VERALDAARVEAETVGCSRKEALDSRGLLVHFTCPVDEKSLTQWSPQDFLGSEWLRGAFSVQALKVRQEVEMYQCKETKHRREEKTGNGKEVRVIESWTYDMTWSSQHISSANFKAWNNGNARRALEEGCGYDFRENPPFRMQADSKSSASLIAGAYDLTRHLSNIGANSPIQLQEGSYYSLGSRAQDQEERRIAEDGKPYTWYEFVDYYGRGAAERQWRNAERDASPTRRASAAASVSGNIVESCPGRETAGCLRISYFQSSAKSVSHMAKVAKRTSSDETSSQKTQAWVAPATWMCSSSSSNARVDIFSEGEQDANEMLDDAQKSNQVKTWAMRAAGIFLAVIGVGCFLQPIQTVANLVDQFFDWFRFIPILGPLLDFFGDVVAGAVGCAIWMIALGIGIPCSVTVLAMTWCVMRPLLGVPMLVGCAAVLYLTVQAMIGYAKAGRSRRQKAE